MGATLTLETETEQDRDQRAVMERAQKLNQVWAIIQGCSLKVSRNVPGSRGHS